MSSFYFISSNNKNSSWTVTDQGHVLKEDVTTVIRDQDYNYYQIKLCKGFTCDGLSVPKMFRWYLPSWSDTNHLYNLSGAIHDALYTLRGANIFSREECDDVFRSLLRDSGISRTKAGIADVAVGIFAGSSDHWRK